MKAIESLVNLVIIVAFLTFFTFGYVINDLVYTFKIACGG